MAAHMAFSKLAVLALLALQSITAYAHISFSVKFPGLPDDDVPFLVHSHMVTMHITVKNHGTTGEKLKEFWAHVSTTQKSGSTDLTYSFSPKDDGTDQDYYIDAGKEITIKYETFIICPLGERLGDLWTSLTPADARFEIYAAMLHEDAPQEDAYKHAYKLTAYGADVKVYRHSRFPPPYLHYHMVSPF